MFLTRSATPRYVDSRDARFYCVSLLLPPSKSTQKYLVVTNGTQHTIQRRWEVTTCWVVPGADESLCSPVRTSGGLADLVGVLAIISTFPCRPVMPAPLKTHGQNMNHFLKREMIRNHIFSFLAWADLKLSLSLLTLRSGEFPGHISLVQKFGNFSLHQSCVILAMWGVAPSCWKVTSLGFGHTAGFRKHGS